MERCSSAGGKDRSTSWHNIELAQSYKLKERAGNAITKK